MVLEDIGTHSHGAATSSWPCEMSTLGVGQVGTGQQ